MAGYFCGDNQRVIFCRITFASHGDAFYNFTGNMAIRNRHVIESRDFVSFGTRDIPGDFRLASDTGRNLGYDDNDGGSGICSRIARDYV